MASALGPTSASGSEAAGAIGVGAVTLSTAVPLGAGAAMLHTPLSPARTPEQ